MGTVAESRSMIPFCDRIGAKCTSVFRCIRIQAEIRPLAANNDTSRIRRIRIEIIGNMSPVMRRIGIRRIVLIRCNHDTCTGSRVNAGSAGRFTRRRPADKYTRAGIDLRNRRKSGTSCNCRSRQDRNQTFF